MTKYIINRTLGKVVNCDRIEYCGIYAKDKYMNEDMLINGEPKRFKSQCSIEVSVNSYGDVVIFAGNCDECRKVLDEIINFLKEDGSIRKFEHGEFYPEFIELGIGTLLPEEEKPKRKTTKKATVDEEDEE